MTYHQPLAAAAAAAVFTLQLGTAVAASDRTPPEPARSNAAVAALELKTLSDARYRAIFCGLEGTETGPGYSRALALDLNALEAAGRTTVEAIAYIEARACGRK
ncbi:MAG: hypothetical protein Q8R01_17920 [Ramlibacter sp.]|nr:hypothetical protein [Ramlibacter sp.]